MSHRKLFQRLGLALIACVLALILAVFYLFQQWLDTSLPVAGEDRVLHVEQGSNLKQVARELQQRDLIKWPELWVLYARLSGNVGLKAGEFLLSERETPSSILQLLQSNAVIQYQVTFVEGWTVQEAVAELQKHQKLKHQLDAQAGIKAIIDEAHVEGWLFPDTYNFSAGETDLSLIKRAYEKMQLVLAEEWAERAENLPYETPYEALIMASIVEKETGAPHERKQIAGVFVRRLQKGMRLQTDPTVIYGMGEDYQGNITRADLKRATPYNTYLIKGLPPTPIALPGRAAIHAALNPADGNTLYFVARGDGTHKFSVTLEEHNRAVQEFQKQRKKNYRSNFVENAGD